MQKFASHKSCLDYESSLWCYIGKNISIQKTASVKSFSSRAHISICQNAPRPLKSRIFILGFSGSRKVAFSRNKKSIFSEEITISKIRSCKKLFYFKRWAFGFSRSISIKTFLGRTYFQCWLIKHYYVREIIISTRCD